MKKDLSELLREADCVPDAPDCRSAVMARISTPSRGRPLVWAYACAAVLIAIAGTWALLPHAQRQAPVVEVVRKAPTPPRQIAHVTAQPAIEKPPQAFAEERVATAPRPRRAHVAWTPPKPVEQPKEAVVVPQPQPPVQTPAPTVRTTGPPVAIAIVTWPSLRKQASNTYSYGYTSRDTQTGNTTECLVKRSGNSVEIYMESKPEASEPPVKGSTGYETKPNA